MSIDFEEVAQRPGMHAAATVPALAAAPTPPFFAVSLFKLVVMSACTAGFYELYWFYRQWQRIREREGSRIMPFWRAFFAVFFCYACFARIRDFGNANGLVSRLRAGLLAAGWVITTMLWRLPDPYWWTSSLSVLFLLPAQEQANRINSATCPVHERNAHFTVWNWIVVVLGGGFMVLALIGTFAPA